MIENLRLEKIEFEKYLICPKCKFIVDNPYEIKCCGTLYCYDCINNFSNYCIKCHELSIFQPNSFAKRIINQMHISCGFGCGGKYTSNEIKNHMLSCELREYNCSFCEDKIQNKNEENITFIGMKKEILKHLLEKHDNEILSFMDNHKKYKNYLEEKEKVKPNSNIEEEKEISERAGFPSLPRLRFPNYVRMPILASSGSRSFEDNSDSNSMTN